MINEKVLDKFNIKKLRPFQEKVIKAWLDNNDLLVLIMTGGGKSLCYQLPCLLKKKIVIVISPLKSLMHDQLDELKKNGINAVIFSGDQNEYDKFDIINNLFDDLIQYNIIYTNPETLNYNTYFLNALEMLYEQDKLGLIVFDEAHCISLWGTDFRPSYRKLSLLRNKIKNVPFMALTATATQLVQDDIKNILNLKKNTVIIRESFERDNLIIKIIDSQNLNIFIDIENKLKDIYRNKCGIIYCNSRKKCELLCEFLLDKGIKTAFYHAGLTAEKRKYIQGYWKNDKIKVVIATIAFGMGINKKDVRFVIHSNLPNCIENYYQEIGRCGRDGNLSDCILYYNYNDTLVHKRIINSNFSDDKDIKYKNHKLDKLNKMVLYLENLVDCRHFLLVNYFGENINIKCNNRCDNCMSKYAFEKFNIKDICFYIFEILQDDKKSKDYVKNLILNKFKIVNNELFERIYIYLLSNNFISELINSDYSEQFIEVNKQKLLLIDNDYEFFIFKKKINKITQFFQ